MSLKLATEELLKFIVSLEVLIMYRTLFEVRVLRFSARVQNAFFFPSLNISMRIFGAFIGIIVL